MAKGGWIGMGIIYYTSTMLKHNWRKRLWRKAIRFYWKRERGGYAYTSPDGREAVEEWVMNIYKEQ